MKNNFGKKFKFYEKVQSLLLVWRMTMGRRSSSTRTATTTKEDEEDDNVQHAKQRQFHWLTQLLQVVGRGWIRLRRRRRPVRRRMDEEFDEEEEESGTWTEDCGAFLIRVRQREQERWGQGTADPIGMLV